MKYCNACGQPVSLRVPEGDNFPRYVCDACLHVHYQNPKIVVGCIPEWEDRILLCRRAIEPRAAVAEAAVSMAPETAERLRDLPKGDALAAAQIDALEGLGRVARRHLPSAVALRF